MRAAQITLEICIKKAQPKCVQITATGAAVLMLSYTKQRWNVWIMRSHSHKNVKLFLSTKSGILDRPQKYFEDF